MLTVRKDLLSRPNWGEALWYTVRPVYHPTADYLLLTIGMVGTTIAPWMQFYLQSAVVEKGIQPRQYAGSRLEVIVGCICTDVVAFFIVVACAATLYLHGRSDIADAAAALLPLAGEYASHLFAFGLFNASLFAASVLPLSTAYSVCEGLGLESGVNKRFADAPVFYWLYTLLIVAGAAAVLWPKMPLVKVMILSQVVNGVLLPFVLIFMLILINRKDPMGEYTNKRTDNLVAWSTTIVMIALTLILAWATAIGKV